MQPRKKELASPKIYKVLKVVKNRNIQRKIKPIFLIPILKETKAFKNRMPISSKSSKPKGLVIGDHRR